MPPSVFRVLARVVAGCVLFVVAPPVGDLGVADRLGVLLEELADLARDRLDPLRQFVCRLRERVKKEGHDRYLPACLVVSIW